MMIGPAPIIRIEEISVRFGMGDSPGSAGKRLPYSGESGRRASTAMF
jgi:hypothetical protein